MKILLIHSCSFKKLDKPALVKNFYTGQLFQMLLKLAKNQGLDWIVISGKYGLLKPNDFIEPYDSKIKTKADIKRIQSLTLSKLKPITEKYDKILVIMGKNYREVIRSQINEKFIVITHEKGLFGYLSLVSKCNKMSKEEFKSFLKTYTYICLNCKYFEEGYFKTGFYTYYYRCISPEECYIGNGALMSKEYIKSLKQCKLKKTKN